MVWVNFSFYLTENTWEAEDSLWKELFHECKWLITRGSNYCASEPGWFRIIFTSQLYHEEKDLSAPFKELKIRLLKWKNKRDLPKAIKNGKK